MLEDIPAKLILNWDQTRQNYVPSSPWTMEVIGSQKVPLTAIDNKPQLTAVFACSLASDFLPVGRPQDVFRKQRFHQISILHTLTIIGQMRRL